MSGKRRIKLIMQEYRSQRFVLPAPNTTKLDGSISSAIRLKTFSGRLWRTETWRRRERVVNNGMRLRRTEMGRMSDGSRAFIRAYGESHSALSRFLVIPRYALRETFKSKLFTTILSQGF